MADIIQIRRDTASNWTSANPTLAQGEMGYETDTDKVKIGDGSTAWTSLGYVIDTGSYISDITGENIGDLSDVTITSASSGQVLKYNGSAWVNSADTDTGITDVVQDTTPQLGGDLASNGNDILFADNDKAVFGAGSDLQIYHSGTASYITDAGTGDLNINAQNISIRKTDGTVLIYGDGNTGVVTLRNNGSTKLTTTSTGVSVTGKAVGTLNTDNDLSFDMNASNQFKCTPTANGTLTFTNITAGQSGNIFLVNSGGYAISAASTTYISAADLSAISTAGSYFLSYFSDGTNVMVSASAAVTSAGA